MILRDLLHRRGAALTAVLTAALISLTAVVLRPPVRASAGSSRAADRRFVLITPRLVRQGEPFTGAIVERTNDRDTPLPAGTRVISNGRALTVQAGGELEFPAFTTESGNVFLSCEVPATSKTAPATSETTPATSDIAPAAQGATTMCVQHVEVLKVPPDLPCRVAHSSVVASSTSPIRVDGQGLDKIERAAMVDENGLKYAVGEPVGSSLERIYVPKGHVGFGAGKFRFTGWDMRGGVYESPDYSINPELTISGDTLRKVGQRGAVTVETNADTGIVVTGGDPAIQLDEHWVPAQPGRPGTIGFTALQVGPYAVQARIVTLEELPPRPGAPRVDARCDVPAVQFDPAMNQTTVRAGVTVTDAQHNPIPDCPVNLAVVHPHGVAYTDCSTDARGQGAATLTLPGEVPASTLEAHPYHIPGHDWSKEPSHFDVIPVDNATPLHHCQGHRLFVIIGDLNDAAINGAAQFGLTLKNVDHRLFFKSKASKTPVLEDPYVPMADNSNWEPYTVPKTDIRGKDTGKKRNGTTEELVQAQFGDCCHFDEVMVIAHGHQKDIYPTLIKSLPVLLNNRPVRRVTLWICGSSDAIYPGNKLNSYYEQLCWILHPRSCSDEVRCNCTHDNCILYKTDGSGVDPNQHCPDGSECVTLLTAGWYEYVFSNGHQGKSKINVGAKLGLGTTPRLDARGKPLKDGSFDWTLLSPDGTMREINICRNGAQKNAGAAGQEPDFNYDIQAQSVTGGTVFDGIPLGKDAGLQQGPYRDADDIPPATRTRTVAAQAPAGVVQPAYSGPRRCDHLAHEGCLPRPVV